MIVFVILYVWQNINVMKVKMNYRSALEHEEAAKKKNDRLRYEIEKLKQMGYVADQARQQNMTVLRPENIDVIETGKKQ
jgi:cell division protein FtsL